MVTSGRIAALTLIGLSIIVAGCVYNKKEVEQVPCTIPATVTYNANIKPIIQSNCYGCHSTGSNIAGFTFDSYASLKIYAQNGRLYGAITHAPGFRPMPDGGGKLSDCTIATIKKWIDTGMPEN